METPPKSFAKKGKGYRNGRDQIWIPSGNKVLTLKILISARTGHGGHIIWRVILDTVLAHSILIDLRAGFEEIVRSFLQFLCTETSKIVTRPLGHSLHAVEPNKLMYLDLCYMYDGEEGLKYVLVFKENHSGYVWLSETKDATAQGVAETSI